jgi:receptor-type tyrosine-protein phosphatase gamma
MFETLNCFFFFNSEPSGKPRVTAAHNTSSTSLYLSWQPPEPNSIHGEFLGYRISYRPRDVGAAKSVEVPIENPKATVSEDIHFL